MSHTAQNRARSLRFWIFTALLAVIPFAAASADPASLTEDLRNVSITVFGSGTTVTTPSSDFAYFNFGGSTYTQTSSVSTALMSAHGEGGYHEGDPTEEGSSTFHIRFEVNSPTHVSLSGTRTGDDASVQIYNETTASFVYQAFTTDPSFDGDVEPGSYYVLAAASGNSGTPHNDSEFDIEMSLSQARFIPTVPLLGPAATLVLAVGLVTVGLRRLRQRA